MHFNAFLQTNQVPIIATNSTCFPNYQCITLKLPPIPEVLSLPIVDTVHCTKAIPQTVTSGGTKKGASANLSTVLVRIKKADPALGPMDGESVSFFYCKLALMFIFEGIGVAQIWLIFRLPDKYGSHPSPLAYVHWFKPLHTPVQNLSFYSVSFSSLNHHQHASVIFISDFVHTCHLIPQIQVPLISVGELPQYIKK